MGSYLNIVDLALDRAEIQGQDTAYIFLADGETESRQLSFTELATEARAVAVAIAGQVQPGARVLLVYEPGLDFLIAFLACQFAGTIAVPVYPPRKPEDWPRFVAIARDCAAAAVCTQQAHAPLLQMGLASTPELGPIAVVASDVVDAGLAGAWQMPDIGPDSLAFLQYTSGSTGVPKGVMVSHANLLNNESVIRQGFGNSADSVVVSWLPQYHDMGLIGGILQPLYLGGRCVLMSPFAFLQQPLRWLKAISKYRGTTSGAPNFAYELCVRRIADAELAQLDLSSWQLAFNGAEPVRLATLERFADKFSACGFRREAFFPCYGLAEATLYVTGASHTDYPSVLHVDAAELERHTLLPVRPDAPGSRALVGAGTAIGHSVRIVDPNTLQACADGRVGEIWVQGPSVARGYWNRPDTTRETFDARIADTGDGPFMRTGDLGVLHMGELFVTGRLKELIIVDGRNHYPQDIEETVQTGRAALRRGCGAAFSVEVDGAEKLVLVQEVIDAHLDADFDGLAADIRASVTARHSLGMHAIAFIRQGKLQKTSSGKIRRRAMRDRYLDGRLDALFMSVGAAASAAARAAPELAPETRVTISATVTERLVAGLIAVQIGLAPGEIDINLPFSAYGLDSRALVGLSGELESQLGRRLAPQLFYNYATIAELARFLAGEPGQGEPRGNPTVSAEPIAIVGMACRLPGAPDLDAFWALLQSGRDAISEVPAERWDIEQWYDADPSTPGKMATRWGGFIEQADGFDADFFNISPREAAAMDPQQRLLLQLAWHALEDAGIHPDAIRGSRTGSFVGISSSDYARLQAGASGLLSAHAGTGNALSIAANRLAYFLDLRGPSLAVDTACSSSLVAVHTAALHLKSGECDMALAGGINLLLSPDVTVSFSQNRMMAADGRCKSFSDQADGYVRGEGGGVVVLKRLSDARAAGDRIWAVIPASACNQDGRSNGLTAPNGLAQQGVLRDALQQAGWQPPEVQFVETHGTGTRLGDPIEAEALGIAYGEGRDARQPLLLGALKSQIGHLEAAAGIAGLIKAALCLSHRTIPANLHCDAPNPLIRLDEWRLALPLASQPWPAAEQPRAGVSAFGFGGTNAHVLLEAAPEAAVPLGPAAVPPMHVLALSARNAASLARLCEAYAAELAKPGCDVASLCRSANTRRKHFRDARRAVAGRSAAELAAALSQATPGQKEDLARPVQAKRGVAFLFTGQGAQYVDMGRRLFECHPEFRAALLDCERLLGERRSPGLLALLYPPAGQAAQMDALLAQTEYTQPALFCLEYALARLWLSWGLRPEVVMGHSVGEFAAAAIAGVFSLQDGLKLIEARGRLMQALPEAGGMLAVFAHEHDLAEILPQFSQRLSLGALNGPGQLVLSGALPELEKVRLLLKQRGIESKPLKVSHAFHSPLMQPMQDAFRQVAESVVYHEPQLPVLSNLTGQLETTRLASADYWVAHVLAPVRFAQGIEQLKRLDIGVLLEIGPRPVLTGMARRMLASQDYLFASSLDAGKDDWQTLGASLAALYEHGVDIDWAAVAAPFAGGLVRAPLYPFDAKRHWFVADVGVSAATVAHPGGHPLLGRALASPRLKPGERHFASEIRLPGPAFFRLPAEPGERRVSLLAYAEMALAAQHELYPENPRCVRDLRLEGLLQVERDGVRALQTLCEPAGEQGYRMEVWAQEGEQQWRRVATAMLCAAEGFSVGVETLASLRARIGQALDVPAWYDSMRDSGLNYCVSPNPAIRRLWWAPSEVLAEVLPQEQDNTHSNGIWLKHSIWHACNQVLGALCPRDGHGTYFPVEASAVRFLTDPGRTLLLHARLLEHDIESSSCTVDIAAYAEDGTLVALVENARLVPDETQRGPRTEWRNAAPDARPGLLAEMLRRLAARAFRRTPDEIPLTEPLTQLGLDSLTTIDIVTRVEQLFEVGVNLALLQQGGSLLDMALMLDERLAEAEGWLHRPRADDSLLIELNRGDTGLPPLFLMHPVGGSVFCYQELARHLGTQPVIAVQAPALAGSMLAFGSLEALAGHYVGHIRRHQPHGPYRLGGWSMGGVIAFEMARQLEAAGGAADCLLLIDALAPGDAGMSPSQGCMLRLLALDLGIDLGSLGEADLDGEPDAALSLILDLAKAQGHALRALTLGDFRRLLGVFEKNVALLATYAGQPYNGTATVLRAEQPLCVARPDASGREWMRRLAGIDALHTVPGDHFSLLSGSHVMLTASYLRKVLKPLNARAAGLPAGKLALIPAGTRSAGNVVIASPSMGEDGVARAGLVVDESHPYFFDHPLDHISGILMIEGLLQLAESAMPARDAFLRHLRLTFPRFCEKNAGATLEFVPAGDGDSWSGRVLQNGRPVCELRLHAGRHLARPPLAAAADAPTPAAARWLHKRRPENVLIGAWQAAGDAQQCALIEPPTGHLLADGDARYYSPLYVLETVRQFITGLAHTEYAVPLDRPMNLIGVELFLDAAVPRGVPLMLRHRLRPMPPIGDKLFAHFEVELLTRDEVLGNCRLTAQLLDRESYRQVRHRAPQTASII
ncbi:beta-ketoacyl synthase N-terminal-like domain-containing protein [Chitinivorax sp. PXF-14]|uniref:beta-ketoacyl synthase N-terminal-like domain-containing protein n=1 Tax=Chitinivorax sp. PXF-14 TaxID=3230488 RepID=UPI0034678758